jgi:methionyl-tRNA formyltransferase
MLSSALRSEPPRVLLIGEGHGFLSLIRGMRKSHLKLQVCSPDEESNKLARDLGIGLHSDLDRWVTENPGGLIVAAGWKPIISANLLDGAVFTNIHYAAIPKYRGMHSIVWALLNGERSIAVTFHEMSVYVDAGPVIWRKKVKTRSLTSWALMEICDTLIEERIGKVLSRYLKGNIKPRPQAEAEATYVTKRNKEDCRVNWQDWDSVMFRRYMRALVDPYPLPFFEWKGQELQIVKAKVVKKRYFQTPGVVVDVRKGSTFVKLRDGILELQVVRHPVLGDVTGASLLSKPGIRL